jgi:hypothetical protein
MNKIYYVIAAVFALALAGEPFTLEQPTELTLGVGNVRAGGGANKSVNELVGQEKGDFTHAHSFTGRVVSVDICPQRSQIQFDHLQLDFVNTSSPALLNRLSSVRPGRVFFEWFPSCVVGQPRNNITPLLLRALRNAFEILSPGGEVLIDHMPYVLSLPTVYSFAYKTIIEAKGMNETHVRNAIAVLDFQKPGVVERLKEPGVMSRLLQEADPFTLHICREEHEQIREYLKFRYKNPSAPYDDSKSLFIQGRIQIIDEIISLIPDLDLYGVTNMVALVNNEQGYYFANQDDKPQGHWHLFEWGYYMKTRRSLIFKALRDIGFVVGEDTAIRFYPINPYNQRRYAWIISAKKP